MTFSLIFFQIIDFDISCILHPLETICMKCKNLFSGNIKTSISNSHLLNFFSQYAKY